MVGGHRRARRSRSRPRARRSCGSRRSTSPATRSAWAQTSVQLDRTAPSRARRSPAARSTWADIASRTITASGSTDAGAGPAGLPVPHLDRRRQHVVGAGRGRLAERLRRGRDAGRVPERRHRRQRVGVDAGADTAGATVRLDRTRRRPPSVSGGSSAWQNATTLPISASGAHRRGGSGVASYQYRTSTNGGTTWSSGDDRRDGQRDQRRARRWSSSGRSTAVGLDLAVVGGLAGRHRHARPDRSQSNT